MKTKTTVEYLVEGKDGMEWLRICSCTNLKDAKHDLVYYKTRVNYPLATLRIIRLTTTTQVKREVVR